MPSQGISSRPLGDILNQPLTVNEETSYLLKERVNPEELTPRFRLNSLSRWNGFFFFLFLFFFFCLVNCDLSWATGYLSEVVATSCLPFETWQRYGRDDTSFPSGSRSEVPSYFLTAATPGPGPQPSLSSVPPPLPRPPPPPVSPGQETGGIGGYASSDAQLLRNATESRYGDGRTEPARRPDAGFTRLQPLTVASFQTWVRLLVDLSLTCGKILSENYLLLLRHSMLSCAPSVSTVSGVRGQRVFLIYYKSKTFWKQFLIFFFFF